MYAGTSRHAIAVCIAAVRVTAGLRCAPEIGPNVKMRTVSAAPVAILFAKRATAAFPLDKRSPMIPDPTTAASKKPVPKNSAAARRCRSILFRALSDNTRLRLLNLMGQDEVCVCYSSKCCGRRNRRYPDTWDTCERRESSVRGGKENGCTTESLNPATVQQDDCSTTCEIGCRKTPKCNENAAASFTCAAPSRRRIWKEPPGR